MPGRAKIDPATAGFRFNGFQRPSAFGGVKGQSPLFLLQETNLKRLFRYEPLGADTRNWPRWSVDHISDHVGCRRSSLRTTETLAEPMLMIPTRLWGPSRHCRLTGRRGCIGDDCFTVGVSHMQSFATRWRHQPLRNVVRHGAPLRQARFTVPRGEF